MAPACVSDAADSRAQQHSHEQRVHVPDKAARKLATRPTAAPSPCEALAGDVHDVVDADGRQPPLRGQRRAALFRCVACAWLTALIDLVSLSLVIDPELFGRALPKGIAVSPLAPCTTPVKLLLMFSGRFVRGVNPRR